MRKIAQFVQYDPIDGYTDHLSMVMQYFVSAEYLRDYYYYKLSDIRNVAG